jgi:hypothetical protein
MILIELYPKSKSFLMKSSFVFFTFVLWLVWLAKIILLEDAIGALR